MTTTGELVEKIQHISRRLRHAYVGALAPLGLTPAQERALMHITRADGPLRMGELAERMNIVPRSVTTLVDALEEAGLVQRTVDPDNRRSILLSLTAAGQDAQAGMAEARRSAGAEIFAHLSEQEKSDLATLLDRVQSNCP